MAVKLNKIKDHGPLVFGHSLATFVSQLEDELTFFMPEARIKKKLFTMPGDTFEKQANTLLIKQIMNYAANQIRGMHSSFSKSFLASLATQSKLCGLPFQTFYKAFKAAPTQYIILNIIIFGFISLYSDNTLTNSAYGMMLISTGVGAIIMHFAKAEASFSSLKLSLYQFQTWLANQIDFYGENSPISKSDKRSKQKTNHLDA